MFQILNGFILPLVFLMNKQKKLLFQLSSVIFFRNDPLFRYEDNYELYKKDWKLVKECFSNNSGWRTKRTKKNLKEFIYIDLKEFLYFFIKLLNFHHTIYKTKGKESNYAFLNFLNKKEKPIQVTDEKQFLAHVFKGFGEYTNASKQQVIDLIVEHTDIETYYKKSYLAKKDFIRFLTKKN